MFDYIELFDGAIRGRLIFLIINCLFIIHFIYFWYVNYQRYGWKMDFWTLITGRFFLIHIFLMFPFNGSNRNLLSLDISEINQVQQYLEFAYIISTVGYISIYFGRALYSSKHLYLDYLFKPLSRVIEKNIKTPLAVNLLSIISLLLLAVVIYFQVKTNRILDPRSFFQANGFWRPLYNACLTLFPLAILFVGLNCLNKGGLMRWSYFTLLVIMSVFLGTRMATLEPLLLLFFFYCIKNNAKINLKRIVIVATLFIYSTILLLNFRSNEVKRQYSNNEINAILYGNTFSDTRDLAYLIANWDKEFLWGKTYTAGLISFIPRQFSEHREKWALGIFTARITNYDSKTFPGFRPGFFGEAYFNFGFAGVILLGTITGYLLRYMDLKIKNIIVNKDDVIQSYAVSVPWFIIGALSISIGFTAFYIFIVITLSIGLVRQLISYFNLLILKTGAQSDQK